MATVQMTDSVERADAAAFAGRLARWDATGPIRLRADGDLVRMWATTPFDALVTRAVRARLEPRDVTVHAGNLAAALAVTVGETVDPGPAVDEAWRSALPPTGGWTAVDEVPASVLAEIAARGAQQAREHPGPGGGAPAALLDSDALTVSDGETRVTLPMRTLLAFSGMGFAPDRPGESARVAITGDWVRIDGRFGAVVRRRQSLLRLLV